MSGQITYLISEENQVLIIYLDLNDKIEINKNAIQILIRSGLTKPYIANSYHKIQWLTHIL